MRARGDDGQRERLTRTGRALGTPNYMSPEQARAVPIDGRADLYALGCVLWELATGEPAFPGSGPMEVMTRQLQEMPDPPSAVADGLPAWFDELLLKSLQKAPDDRYEDAEAMGAALAAGLERLDSEGGAPPAMEPAGPADSTSIPPARRPGSPRATQEQPVTGGEDPGPEGSPAPPPERSRKPWALAAAASVLLAAAVGAFAVLDGPGGDDAPGEAAQEGAVVSTVEEPAPPHGDPSPQRGATPPETGEADVPAGGDAAAEDAGPVSHESVVLELRVEPRGTRVFRNDEVLGTTPLTLTVEASEEEVDYRFEHPGREPATLSIRHDRARTIERTLETVAEAPTRPTAERRRPAQVEAEPEAPESGRSELMRPALPMDEEGP